MQTGPISVRIRSRISSVQDGIAFLYQDYPLADDSFCDFHVKIVRPLGARRWVRPQALFLLDDFSPFKPLPLEQAFPLFEWGMNWCVANHMHQYLILHAAVIAYQGRAVILPGEPGAGKSTLCATLVSRGWQLLSDELTLISNQSGKVVPIPRPVSLKNESIDVMRRFHRADQVGVEYRDTTKGTVAHMRAPTISLAGMDAEVTPAFVVAPKFDKTVQAEFTPESKAQTFMFLAQNGFNYHVLGPAGFDLLADLIDQCACYRFHYSDMEQAVSIFQSLVDAPEAAQ